MFYTSTRNNSIKIQSAQAIIKGLSNEGGLFVPESFPTVTPSEINDMSALSYQELALRVMSMYFTDFTGDELWQCVQNAYTNEKFKEEAIAPLHSLDDTTYFLELWHGPTSAFKDMALQILPHLMTVSAAKTKENKKIAILTATSGDTGKAALEGFKNVDGTLIAVFYPAHGVSEIQELQMKTGLGDNAFVCSVLGNFDDTQNGVKRIFTDEELRETLSDANIILSSANSINIGRLIPQIVYYFSAYCTLLKTRKITLGEKINFVVPTGNFGNILAAYYAGRMGLPINKLICASNRNNILTEFINTGVYNKERDFYTTISPSMDILISSNLERFLYEISGKSAADTALWMYSLANRGSFSIPKELKNIIEEQLYGGYCDDAKTKEIIRQTYIENKYLIDTHTAVGKAVYNDYKNETKDQSVTVIASTASPYKFAADVLAGIDDNDVNQAEGLKVMKLLMEKTGAPIPKPLSELSHQSSIETFACEGDEMKAVILDFFKKKK